MGPQKIWVVVGHTIAFWSKKNLLVFEPSRHTVKARYLWPSFNLLKFYNWLVWFSHLCLQLFQLLELVHMLQLTSCSTTTRRWGWDRKWERKFRSGRHRTSASAWTRTWWPCRGFRQSSTDLANSREQIQPKKECHIFKTSNNNGFKSNQ